MTSSDRQWFTHFQKTCYQERNNCWYPCLCAIRLQFLIDQRESRFAGRVSKHCYRELIVVFIVSSARWVDSIDYSFEWVCRVLLKCAVYYLSGGFYQQFCARQKDKVNKQVERGKQQTIMILFFCANVFFYGWIQS